MSYLPNDALENAFKVLIDAGLVTLNATLTVPVTVYTGIGEEEKALPCVIVSVFGTGEEDPVASGNFNYEPKVEIKTKPFEDTSETPNTERQSIVDAVYSALMIDDLPQQLSAAVSDLTVFDNGSTVMAPTSTRDAKGAWVDELNFTCYCCARGGL